MNVWNPTPWWRVRQSLCLFIIKTLSSSSSPFSILHCNPFLPSIFIFFLTLLFIIYPISSFSIIFKIPFSLVKSTLGPSTIVLHFLITDSVHYYNPHHYPPKFNCSNFTNPSQLSSTIPLLNYPTLQQKPLIITNPFLVLCYLQMESEPWNDVILHLLCF